MEMVDRVAEAVCSLKESHLCPVGKRYESLVMQQLCEAELSVSQHANMLTCGC